jgi:hypothetical protein
VSLGCGTGVIVLFLLQAITDKVIESGTVIGTHMLHHFWIQFSLETSNSFSICINHIRSITAQVVEDMQILHHGFWCPDSKPRTLPISSQSALVEYKLHERPQ